MLCKPAVLCVVARTASATGATQQFRSVLDLVREHGSIGLNSKHATVHLSDSGESGGLSATSST
jgi:hypothetical protein